jgi:hypothetical protein
MKETRKCCKCKKVKEVSEFYTRIDRESGIRSMCKKCLLSFNKTYAADSGYFKKRNKERKKHPTGKRKSAGGYVWKFQK